MSRRVGLSYFTAASLLLGVAGCTSSSPPATDEGGQPTSSPAAQSGGPTAYALGDLKVGLADYLPPLDDGRIEIAGPKDWQVGARQTGYVVWFHRYKDAQTLPQIRVKVEDAPAEAPQDVTKENVEAFAKWLSGHVQKDLKTPDELIEQVRPLILGDNAFGRYVRLGRYRGAGAEQHMLVTIRGGRMYTLQELVIAGDLGKPDIRDAAYVVGASMKFTSGAPASTELSLPAPTETSAP